MANIDNLFAFQGKTLTEHDSWEGLYLTITIEEMMISESGNSLIFAGKTQSEHAAFIYVPFEFATALLMNGKARKDYKGEIDSYIEWTLA